MKPIVVVTGGAGYIGSHTVVELQHSGYQVIIIDNFSNSDKNVIDAIEKITGEKPLLAAFDLSDECQTRNFFASHHVDAIIHFAAYKYVGESVEQPLRYYRNNFFTTLNLLTAMKEQNIRHFVFSSSCTVYGEPDHLPVTEETPIKPAICPYGNTKQVIEEILSDVANVDKNLNIIALRYFNPIGAHHSALIGERPNGVPQNLLPYITQTAMGIRPCLSVYGNDYHTPDGTCLRDYIHVVDLAKAHVAAIERMTNGKMSENYEVFNVGTGKPTSVLEIINSFERVTGKKVPYKIVGRRSGDIEKVWADTKKINNVMGWKAALTLDDMLLSAWKWEQTMQK